jgi:putative nucleotidyltransferase with HDIG domain
MKMQDDHKIKLCRGRENAGTPAFKQDGKVLERKRLMDLAWQIMAQLAEVRPEKVASLKAAVKQDSYQADYYGIKPKFPLIDCLDISTIMAEHPSLISEHLAIHGRSARQRHDCTMDLLRTMETRDRYSGTHSIRVSKIALNFGRYLGLSDKDVEILQISSLLHDLGKMEVSQAILLKSGPLTPDEKESVEKHPLTGVRIAEPLSLKPQEEEIIMYHHERWDGKGYPFGLSGKEIPFPCRIISLADVFAALTSDRPYRPRYSVSQSLELIQAHVGTHFDPHLTTPFKEMVSLSLSK